MSTNCISCVVAKRTGADLLCDACRRTRLQRFQRDGRKYLNGLFQLWNSEGNRTVRQLAHHANCDLKEVLEAMEQGTGPVGDRPEPRVLFRLCKLMDGSHASYANALTAFGHLVPRTDQGDLGR